MCIYLLGQQPRLHGVVDDSDPLQDAPPQSGVGSEQLLHRVLIPSPHVLEQFPYGPQLPQPPSTENNTYDDSHLPIHLYVCQKKCHRTLMTMRYTSSLKESKLVVVAFKCSDNEMHNYVSKKRKHKHDASINVQKKSPEEISKQITCPLC